MDIELISKSDEILELIGRKTRQSLWKRLTLNLPQDKVLKITTKDNKDARRMQVNFIGSKRNWADDRLFVTKVIDNYLYICELTDDAKRLYK